MLTAKESVKEFLKDKGYSHKTVSHINDAARAISIAETYKEYVTKLFYDEIDEKTFNKELRNALIKL